MKYQPFPLQSLLTEESPMKQVQPDVWETESYSPFSGLNTHAYLLTRPDGNWPDQVDDALRRL